MMMKKEKKKTEGKNKFLSISFSQLRERERELNSPTFFSSFSSVTTDALKSTREEGCTRRKEDGKGKEDMQPAATRSENTNCTTMVQRSHKKNSSIFADEAIIGK